ncbi:MAG: hypothetical protein ACLVAT_02560 [Lachnospiraceae bacterium]
MGTTPSRELYKFFDREGNTLVLRPDFTTFHRESSFYVLSPGEGAMPNSSLLPRRNTFVPQRTASSYQGRLKESTTWVQV